MRSSHDFTEYLSYQPDLAQEEALMKQKLKETPYTFYDFTEEYSRPALGKTQNVSLPNEEETIAFTEEITETPALDENTEVLSEMENEDLWPSEQAAKLISESEENARQLIEKAAASASEILEMAKDKASLIEADAQKAGYQEGYQDGLAKGLMEGKTQGYQEMAQKYTLFFEGLQQALETVDRLKEERLQEYLEEMKDLVLTVTKKIIHISLASGSEVIKRMILTEAEAAQDVQWCKLYISAKDDAAMKEDGIDLQKMLAGYSERIKIDVWEDADPGTCILEFPNQVVDASVNTQIDNLQEEILRFSPENASAEQEMPFVL